MAEQMFTSVTVSDQPFEQVVLVETGNFVRLPVELLTSKAWRDLSPTASKVLVQMYSYRNNQHGDDQVWPRAETLANVTGVSQATVYRVLQEISRAKLIRKLARGYRHQGEVWQLLNPTKNLPPVRNSHPREQKN